MRIRFCDYMQRSHLNWRKRSCKTCTHASSSIFTYINIYMHVQIEDPNEIMYPYSIVFSHRHIN